MKDLFITCLDLFENAEDVVMISIINQAGSAPRTAGSKMLVKRDGTIAGTIGGGIFEAEAINMAKDVFVSRQSITRTFTFSCSDVAGMDMICGGRAEIFVDLLRHDLPCNKVLCRAICDLKRRDQDAFLITKLVAGPGSEEQVKLALMIGDQIPAGMSILEKDLDALLSVSKERRPRCLQSGEARYLIEPVYNPGTVFIFGAGHVSQKLAYLTAFTGFQTVILDDREEYANAVRFPHADQIIVPVSMERCVADLPVTRDSYIVIVTRGHTYDLTVLEQALKTDAGYIGMIGSRRKREIIYQRLRRSGIPEEAISRVHSPIGIDIKSETPEEIAVSIIAELVMERARLIDG